MAFQGCNDIDREGVRKLAKQLDLPDSRERDLYNALSLARDTFDAWCDATPKNSAVAARLHELEGSIARLAQASRCNDRQWAKALRIAASAAESWAAEQFALAAKARQESIEMEGLATNDDELRAARKNGDGAAEAIEALNRLGFIQEAHNDPGTGLKAVAYGADEVLTRWLQLAPLMLDIWKQAQRHLKAESTKAWEGAPGVHEWLCGKRLPEIYEQFSGGKFGISKQSDQVTLTTGIAFAIEAHKAMGLEAISPDTIASHFKNYRRRKRTSG